MCGICTSPGGSSFPFHNRHSFKPTWVRSGPEGEGLPGLQPCLTLPGRVSSPRAFPMTLGLHALAASWPHRRVELGTQSRWRCCHYLCVTLGKITPYPHSSFPSLKNRDSTSPLPGWGAGRAEPDPWQSRPRQEEAAAQHQGHAASSEPRTESPASPPHAVAVRQGRNPCVRSCPAPRPARTPYGTETLPVSQEQKAVMGKDTTPCLLSGAD